MASQRRPHRDVDVARFTARDVEEALVFARAEQAKRLVDIHIDLEQEIAHYISLFLDAPIAYLTLDHRGTIIEANNAAATLLDTPLQRPAGKPFVIFVHSPDTPLFQQHLANCRLDGGARVQLRLRREGGEPRPVELVTRAAKSPRLNRRVSRTIIVDAEAAQQRERAVARSEKGHREIIETASEGICIVNQHNDVVLVNRRFAAMVGLPTDDLVGRSAYEFVPNEERGKAREKFDKRTIGTDSEEMRLRRADGSLLWTTVSGSLMRDDHGRFTGMLRMYADATSEHELDDARETLMRELITAQERERERIARELHDQMGQHIVALGLGVAKLARLTEQVGEAQPVLNQLRQIVELVGRDVHTLAFQLRPAALDHLGLAVALTSYAEDVSKTSAVEIDVHCDDLTALHLSGATQTALYRVAQEGVTNALKHASATRVSVIVERRGDALLLIVEDDGVGLRESPERPTRSGVGLTGMRERVMLLGGTLSIESSRGHGTTLYARIPLKTPCPESHHEQTPSAAR